MKKSVSLLVVLCMLFSLCGTIFVNAAPPADKTVSTEVAAIDTQDNEPLIELDITGVAAPVAGQMPTVEGITCSDPDLTITAGWMVYNYTGETVWETVEGAFENNKVYGLNMILGSTEAEFPEYEPDRISVSVNGADTVYAFAATEYLLEVNAYYPVGGTPITSLNITGVCDTSVGAVMTTDGLQAENTHVLADWWCYGDAEVIDGVSVFQEGYNYVLDIYLYPENGYYFAPGMEITIEGEPYDVFWQNNTAMANVGREVRHVKEEVYEVFLDGTFPVDIYPGAVPQLDDIVVKDGPATVTDIYWESITLEPVTTFEDGKLYYLAVALKAEDGYRFTDDTNVYNYYIDTAYEICEYTEDTYIARFRYDSLMPVLEKVDISLNGVGIGKNIADVTVVTDNPDVYADVVVMNAAEDIEEETFRQGHTYRFEIELYSDTYVFGYETEILFDGEYQNAHIYGTGAYFSHYVSFRQHIEEAEFTVAKPVIGQAPGAPNLPAGANYVIDGYYWYEVNDEYDREMEPGDVFQDDCSYWLYISALPAEGYDFADDIEVIFNGEACEHISVTGDKLCLEVENFWSFQDPPVDHVELVGLPKKIVPGAAPKVTPSVEYGEASVTEAYWTDADMNRVTTLADGKLYYLNVVLKAEEGYRFYGGTSVSADWSHVNYDVSEYTKDTYIARFRYSLVPIAEKVNFTVAGIEIGKNVEDVTVTVVEPAGEIFYEIMQYEGDGCWGEMREGTFQDGESYMVDLYLRASTYEFDYETEVYINGQRCDDVYIYDDGLLCATQYASFKEHIHEVKVTVPEPVVGQTPGVPTVPADANYMIGGYYWRDTTHYEVLGPGDKFEDGKRYQLNINLIPKRGYDFAEDATLTLNGKAAEDYFVDRGGVEMGCDQRWSFAKPIDKIELPSFPKTLKPGAAPKITSIETDKYTIEGFWVDVEEDEMATTIENGKYYYLVYNVELKSGYEIDMMVTQVLQDGKTYTGIWQYDYNFATAIKTYAVGVQKVVDRIDLNITAPALGQTPKPITVPKNDQYEIDYYYWGENSTGNMYDLTHDVTGQFTTGKYYFSSMSINTKNGYVITEDTQIYINGVKADPLIFWAMGNHAAIAMLYQPLSDGAGDFDGNGGVDNKDVEYLLWYTLFPDSYPVGKNADFDGNGSIDNKDVEYLLWHTLFPGSYPINK